MKTNHRQQRLVSTIVTLCAMFFALGMFVDRPVAKIIKQTPVVQLVPDALLNFEVNDARYLAYQILTKQQFDCLDYVVTNESHWNNEAKNPTSSAKGIGQLLASTYKNIGLKYSHDPRSQLIATLAYISERYGSGGPCAAKAHWVKFSWY